MKKSLFISMIAFFVVAACGISLMSCTAQRTLSVSQDTITSQDGRSDTVKVSFKMQEQYRSTKKTSNR